MVLGKILFRKYKVFIENKYEKLDKSIIYVYITGKQTDGIKGDKQDIIIACWSKGWIANEIVFLDRYNEDDLKHG